MHDRKYQNKPLSWFGLFLCNRGGWALIAAVPTLVLSVWCVWLYFDTTYFLNNALPIKAEVVAVSETSGGKGWNVVLRFAPDGITQEQTMDVYDWYVEKYPVGSTDTIYYLPDNPARIETTRSDMGLIQSSLAGWGATVFGVLALIALWFPGIKTSRAILARRYGARIAAELVEKREVRTRHGIAIRLIWKEPSGRFGQTEPLVHRQAAAYELGQTLYVFHGPKRSWWEGETGPRAAKPKQMPTVPRPTTD